MKFFYQNGEFTATTVGDYKQIIIDGPIQCELSIDYDDVNHTEVQTAVKKLVDILEEHKQQL